MSNDLVIPIALPQINWETYLTTIRDHTGHSPARGVDKCSSPLSSFAKYTASLAEFELSKEADARASLRRPGPHLQHVSMTFLILTSNICVLRIAEGTGLDVISSKAKKQRIAIVSGNLQEWRDAIIVFCKKDGSSNLRWIFNEIKFRLGQIGLADIFHGYETHNLQDNTFYLEYKP